MGERYNEGNPGKEEYLKSYKFLNSAYNKILDGELSPLDVKRISEEKAIYEHSRSRRQALSREIIFQSIKSHPDYSKYKDEIDKYLAKAKGGIAEEGHSFFSFFQQQPEPAPLTKPENHKPQKEMKNQRRESPQKTSQSNEGENFFSKLFGGNESHERFSGKVANEFADYCASHARGDLDGKCGRGVYKLLSGFANRRGIDIGDIPTTGLHGKNWADILEGNPHFKKISITDPYNVPKGAILSYGRGEYGTADRNTYGHVEVCVGNGTYAYDGIAYTPGGSAMNVAGKELSLKEMGFLGAYIPVG